ncbi:hypothetical protein BC939DRAFT_496877 [Gamsiella multidivaricata]|uniref:uncharacterized protein n=1 Tax=Gamsiella multidivaricata TaxID=101098 RepID=UPI00221F28FE|nr:uncharacterized protein BC939DRAFT_496877 [Gamsiella multidivaricata]KAI7817106.1 hypothetical protein BC939DRAFT_496877 [Gamsiella multidivaricata]
MDVNNQDSSYFTDSASGAGQTAAVARSDLIKQKIKGGTRPVMDDHEDSKHASLVRQNSAEMSVDGSDGDALFISPGSSCPPSPGSANLSRTSSGGMLRESKRSPSYAQARLDGDGRRLLNEPPSPTFGHSLNDRIDTVLADQEPIPLNLLTDRLRRVELISDGAQWPIQFDEQLERSLKSLADEHDVDVHVVLLSAWGALLSRLSGQSELDIAFREDAAMDASTYLPLHVDLLGDPNTVQLLEHSRAWTECWRTAIDFGLN